ncbi:EAL domain-containing protein [Halomonas aquatica]|uniref:EAL domain-containing protein n=1 Tax=Halomonas aquatica TaxID=3151123 RepID=A0ABV1NGQ4_9GAMM
MIDVGHALDLQVTAEDVETREEAAVLCQLGCDQAQGFHYTADLPDTEYHAWCRHHADELEHS